MEDEKEKLRISLKHLKSRIDFHLAIIHSDDKLFLEDVERNILVSVGRCLYVVNGSLNT